MRVQGSRATARMARERQLAGGWTAYMKVARPGFHVFSAINNHVVERRKFGLFIRLTPSGFTQAPEKNLSPLQKYFIPNSCKRYVMC